MESNKTTDIKIYISQAGNIFVWSRCVNFSKDDEDESRFDVHLLWAESFIASVIRHKNIGISVRENDICTLVYSTPDGKTVRTDYGARMTDEDYAFCIISAIPIKQLSHIANLAP